LLVLSWQNEISPLLAPWKYALVNTWKIHYCPPPTLEKILSTPMLRSLVFFWTRFYKSLNICRLPLFCREAYANLC